MIAIFESEITTLESQLNEISQRILVLREAENQLEQATGYLSELIKTAQPLGKLNDVKQAVLSLFGTDGNDGNGNTPAPEPQPIDDAAHDEPLPIIEALQQAPIVEAAPEPEPQQEPEPAPVEEVEPNQPKGYTELKQLSKSVSYLVNYRGEILASYVSSNNAGQLRKLAKDFIEPLAKGWNLRTEGDVNKRTTVTKYEIRILDLSLSQIKKVAAQVDGWQEETPQPKPAIELPEYTLIRDTSADSLLGEIWGVHGIGNDRRQYGTVREHLMHPGQWLNSKQRNINITYSSKEDAAKALVSEWANDRQLHNDMNQAIASKYLAG